MRLEYISHSRFAIETGNTRIVFVPCITDSAYNQQWFLHPKPVNIEPVINADIS